VRLTEDARNHLAAKFFALSGRRFPIQDETHARAALVGAIRSRQAGNLSPAEYSEVVRKAHEFIARNKRGAK